MFCITRERQAEGEPEAQAPNVGLFLGRALGCGLFLGIAFWGSGVAALKYALPVIAMLQLLSIWVARRILRGLPAASSGIPLVEILTANKLEA